MAVDPTQAQQIPPEVLAALSGGEGAQEPAQGDPAAQGAPDPQQGAPGAPGAPEGDGSSGGVDSASAGILNAIIAGCQTAALASEPGGGEDFMRFAQGVNQLVQALDNLHSPPAGITSQPPQPEPAPHEVALGQAQAAKTLMEAIQMPAELALRQRQAAQRASRPTGPAR